jgi:signal transduction histidine kinase
MTQVLTNILDNALRHTPEGGMITLAARPASAGVEISIRDTGSGLIAEDLDRIFDRFYRADAARHRGDGGSGLGLAIARSIVQAHNGTIRANQSAKPDHHITILLRGYVGRLSSAPTREKEDPELPPGCDLFKTFVTRSRS